MQLPEFLYSDEGEIGHDWGLDVMFDAFNLSSGFVVSDGPWYSYESVANMFGAAVVEEDVAEEPPIHVDDVDFEDCPWLLEFLGPHARGSSANDPSQGRAARRLFDDDEGDFAAESIMDELARIRMEMAEEEDAHIIEYYAWQVRGGVWTARHTGMAYDSYRAFAKLEASRDWCRDCLLTPSASFYVTVYGALGAMEMSKFWARKHEWMFQVWRDHPGAAADMPGDLFDGFEEPEAIANLYLGGNDRVRRRIDELRALRPR
jgi:hypothetical protein